MTFQIYYLDSSPVECAKAHTDDHVKEMCFDFARLLSYIHLQYFSDSEIVPRIYLQKTLPEGNDMLFQWSLLQENHFQYIISLWSALLDEHKTRFGKEHVSASMLPLLDKFPTHRYWARAAKKAGRSQPPLLIDQEFWRDNNKRPTTDNASALNSYRQWYLDDILADGRHAYTDRGLPTWAQRAVAAVTPAIRPYGDYYGNVR